MEKHGGGLFIQMFRRDSDAENHDHYLNSIKNEQISNEEVQVQWQEEYEIELPNLDGTKMHITEGIYESVIPVTDEGATNVEYGLFPHIIGLEAIKSIRPYDVN